MAYAPAPGIPNTSNTLPAPVPSILDNTQSGMAGRIAARLKQGKRNPVSPLKQTIDALTIDNQPPTLAASDTGLAYAAGFR